jgi:hypothetical protein
MTQFETTFEQPIPDGRAEGEMLCETKGCKEQATTWCPLCQMLLCAEHDELTPRRMHDCLVGPADS